MKEIKPAPDIFNEWFDTKGVRTYSSNHGSADGHREYMAAAFLDGFHEGMKQALEIIKGDD
jgi:hypothetical protein